MGKTEVKPSLFCKRSLLTSRITTPSVSRNNLVPNKLSKLDHQRNGQTVMPSLFNKALSIKSQESRTEKPAGPSLFGSESLLPSKPTEDSSSNKPITNITHNAKPKEDRAEKRKLNYNLSKQNSLINATASKIPPKVTRSAGKPAAKKQNVVTEKYKSKRKKKDAQLEMLSSKIKEFKLDDNAFKKEQLRIMRSKLKLESEGMFVDSKQGNFDMIKQEKKKLIKEKVILHYFNIIC